MADAWELVAERLRVAQERTDFVLRTLHLCNRVKLTGDGRDEARILCMLKSVVDKCTVTQDFSQMNILLVSALLPNEPHSCPLCSH